MKDLPEKTVERLSLYRRSLLEWTREGKTHIFSHELAAAHHLTAVQVRRDLMLINYTGTLRKGYNVAELTVVIGEILDPKKPQHVCVVGAGSLGSAIMGYFSGKRSMLKIVATFDVAPDRVGAKIAGVPCHHIDDLTKIIKKEKITIAILTIPSSEAISTTQNLIDAGVKGILNYTPVRLNVPENIFLEEYDMTTSIEKIAYFVK